MTSNVKHDVSLPLRSLKGVKQVAITPREHRKHPHAGPELPRDRDSSTPGTGSPSMAAMPSTSINFEGLGSGFVGPSGTFTMTGAPSDSNGAVGPDHYVEIVNTSIGVFNKNGTAIYGPVATNTLFTGFGGLCQTDNDGDGSVVYDQLANRWVIMQFAISGVSVTNPYLICVAVSTTGDPTGTYYRYSFTYANFPDYPKLGVWPDGYYVSVNQFNAAGTVDLGPMVAALDRNRMLNGLAATQQTVVLPTIYGGLLPATLDGRNAPPAGSPGYFMDLGSNALHIWKFHVDWSNTLNTTFSLPATVPVAGYSQACGGGACVPQSGTVNQLDSLGDRLMYRLAYRNFGDHESLVTNHSVTAGSSTGVRWYEIRSPGARPAVYQQGTYAPDSNFRWMGSVAMDASGDMAAGFSVSSSALNPQIHYAGRLAGDALGTMPQGEGTIINGGGSQTGTLHRSGDYSSLAVDPTDDCTFWYTAQYLTANGTFNWHTRVGSFKFPSCGTPDFSLPVSPSNQSVVRGSSTTYTVTLTPTSTFSGAVQLSASGLPAGASATFSPNPATSTSTMTVTTSSTTPTGSSTITVTGTNGNLSHTATTTLAVSPGASYAVGAVGTDNGLWVLRSGSPNFTRLGGVLLGAPAVVAVPQATGPASPIYIATGSDHALYVRNDAHGWQVLAGGPTHCTDSPAGVVIAGTLYIACEGGDRSLWHVETPAPSGTDLPMLNVSSWQSLGGTLIAGPAVGSVGGTPTYLVVGTDHHVYSRDLSSGFIRFSWACIGHPALAAFGSTSYFGCHGTDNALWYATNTGSGWSGAQSLGGTLVDGVGLAATLTGPVFFVEGTNGAVYHRSISSGWTPDGGQVRFGVGACAL